MMVGAFAAFVLTAAISGVGIFVDERIMYFDWFSVPVLFGFLIAWAITGTTELTYLKKPRGWRKDRRQREREAYIEQLERELGFGDSDD